MVDIHDYDIQCIEQEILWKYDKSPCDYPDCDCLLSLRRNMIDKRVLAHQEEILPDIIAFNYALTAALRELYDRAHRIWNCIKDNEDFKDAEIVLAEISHGNPAEEESSTTVQRLVIELNKYL